MSFADDINRILREHRRYTGDGLPGEPVNAPLPIGLPNSGRYPPKKSEMREVFAGLAADLEAGVAAAIAAADLAIAVGGSAVVNYATRDAAAAATIPAARSYVYVEGVVTMGDAPTHRYKRVVAEPTTHAAKFRSVDRFLPNGSTDAGNGGWWELSMPIVNARFLNAKGDGTTADYSALVAAELAARMLGKPMLLDTGTYQVATSFVLGAGVTVIIEGNVTINATGVLGIQFGGSNITFISLGKFKLNGPRTPTTGSDYVFGNYGFYFPGTSGARQSRNYVSGNIEIANFKHGGFHCVYNDDSFFGSGLYIRDCSHHGIFLLSCRRVKVMNPVINGISSSDYPAADPRIKNAYGCAMSIQDAGNVCEDCVIVSPLVLNVPTWSAYDMHGGRRCYFVAPKCAFVRTGFTMTNTLGNENKYCGAIDCDFHGGFDYPTHPGGTANSMQGAAFVMSGVADGSGPVSNGVVSGQFRNFGANTTGVDQSLLGQVYISDVYKMNIHDVQLDDGSYHGFTMVAVTGSFVDGVLSGIRINNQTTFNSENLGIYVSTTVSQVRISDVGGNSAGTFVLKALAPTGGFPKPYLTRDIKVFNATQYAAGYSIADFNDLGASSP